MVQFTPSPIVLDCSSFVGMSADMVLNSVRNWVESFPRTADVRVVVPSQRFGKQLQRDLQALGCRVTRRAAYAVV